MHISAKSDYALRALIVMARTAKESDAPLPAEAMATAQDIPQNFLLAILADLRRAGIVRSKRGQGGGWHLGRDASEISVADVIRAVDGPLVSVHGLRPEAVTYRDFATVLQPVWIAARSGLREVLESVSLGDLASGELPDAVRARTAAEDAWEPR
ncbi:RrF2 family transcriptional regulator [Ornithinimicrobium cavernae]|uniref:RrF2 family transcriptional regulator n=1 Tax=Ornithinimicrobium cavernae TaxID=2666047 RepID=UPI000D688006|nr:Rrf2 family transcriptional regulator [Ornithinimicrobium cavernae]